MHPNLFLPNFIARTTKHLNFEYIKFRINVLPDTLEKPVFSEIYEYHLNLIILGTF